MNPPTTSSSIRIQRNSHLLGKAAEWHTNLEVLVRASRLIQSELGYLDMEAEFYQSSESRRCLQLTEDLALEFLKVLTLVQRSTS